MIASIHGALQGNRVCPSGVVFRGGRGKDLWKFYRSEKAGTRTETVYPFRSGKRRDYLWSGTDDGAVPYCAGDCRHHHGRCRIWDAQETVLPQEIITAVEDCGFFESIPLWAVTLIGGLFITVLSFIMIMSVYGRFFRLYLYTAIAPVPLSTFAGEPTQNVGKSF